MTRYLNRNQHLKRSKLPFQTQRELLTEFCEALLSLKNTNEAVKFLVDLLTKSEALMLAKRIKIAKLLLKGKTYREIEDELKVSHGTITKVMQWLSEGGEGFRMIAARTKKKEKQVSEFSPALSEWNLLKRRRASIFWPQLLIEEIIKSANKRQKEKFSNALKGLNHKSKVYKDISRILRKYY